LAWLEIFGGTDCKAALGHLKGCWQHYQASITCVKRNRSVIRADGVMSSFIFCDYVVRQRCNRGETIPVSPSTEYCLRIWIPKNTVFVLSHFPETIYTYCLWKVRVVFCIVLDD
jgi:hypothetical protein